MKRVMMVMFLLLSACGKAEKPIGEAYRSAQGIYLAKHWLGTHEKNEKILVLCESLGGEEEKIRAALSDKGCELRVMNLKGAALSGAALLALRNEPGYGLIISLIGLPRNEELVAAGFHPDDEMAENAGGTPVVAVVNEVKGNLAKLVRSGEIAGLAVRRPGCEDMWATEELPLEQVFISTSLLVAAFSIDQTAGQFPEIAEAKMQDRPQDTEGESDP